MNQPPSEPALSTQIDSKSQESRADLYRQLDADINDLLRIDVGFTTLIRAGAYPMPQEEVDAFRARYELIREFQERTLAVFRASLKGECDPQIAAAVLADVPPHLGVEYHRQLTERQHQPPVFFRTDEPVPGKLSEIQCPGSGWCVAEELLTLYRNNPAVFGESRHFRPSMAASFTENLRKLLLSEPVVHHLLENASRPHGMRYFIQRTREHGMKYFSYDRGVAPQDCNFIRSHDFITLPHHNFFVDRMQRCERGETRFDLSPSVLFDGKMIMSWPFWSKTREFYSDRVRSLFPFTNVIQLDGFDLPDGRRVTPEEFCQIGRSKRDFFVKYGGSDIALNWGSKAVFLTSTMTTGNCRDLMHRVLEDTARGRHWVIQQAFQHDDKVPVLSRDGEVVETEAHSKFSGFYGPQGLMGILVMQKASHKVHGSEDTVSSMVY